MDNLLLLVIVFAVVSTITVKLFDMFKRLVSFKDCNERDKNCY
jgi:hypothetical protein